MKKKVFLGVSIFSMLLMSCGGSEETTEEVTDNGTEEVVIEPVTYSIDVENTVVNWMGYEFDEAEGVHQAGTVKALSGEVTIEGDVITMATMEIDMNSIASEAQMEDLDGHLKNEDFFDINNYAASSFTFDRHEGGMIYGSISVIGMDLNVEAPVEVVSDESSLTINVSEFRVDMTSIPFFVEDATMPAEEQHNSSVGFTATIVATK